MRDGPLANVVERLRQAVLAGTETDAHLVQEFLSCRSEHAFRILVRRHGPMVFGVCRRWLGHVQDAEDAFQAVFLVFSRKAGAIEPPEAVGRWLYGVAVRTARKAKVQRERRQSRQSQARQQRADPPRDGSEPLDWLPLLDEELHRLPDKHRLPIVLCDLLGRSRHEAAAELGIAEGTLSSRLARARERLRERLQRRGIVPAAGISVLGATAGLNAEVARSLSEPLVHACCGTATASISNTALRLAEGVLQAMFVSKLPKLLAVSMLVTLLGGLGWSFAPGLMTDGPAAAAKSVAVNETAEPKPPAEGKNQPPAKLDRFGDPLPPGAVLRLGTERFRPGGMLAFAPDGKLAAAHSDTFKLFDPETGRTLAQIRTQDEPFNTFAFSPDGKKIVSMGYIREDKDYPTRSAIRVWDAQTLREIKTIRRPDQVGSGMNMRMVLAANGKIAVTTDPQSIRLWDLEGTEALPSHPLGEVEALAVSPDGSLIAFAKMRSNELFLWEWQTKIPPRRIQLNSFPRWFSLEFSPDAKTLALGADGAGVSLWNVATGKLLRKLPDDRTNYVRSMAFTLDGKHLITPFNGPARGQSYAGSVCIWEVATGQLARELPTSDEVIHYVALSRDGTRLAASGLRVHVWDTKTWEKRGSEESAHHSRISALGVSRTGLLLSGSGDRTVRLWDLRDGKPLHVFSCGEYIRAVALSPDGRRAAGTILDVLLVWDTVTGKTLFRLPGHGQSYVNALSFTADGQRLLSFGTDFNIRVNDLANGKALSEHAIRPNNIKVPDADSDPNERQMSDFQLISTRGTFSPDGRSFICLSQEDFFVYDVATGKERLKFPNPGDFSTTMTVSADSKSLLTGSSSRPVPTVLPNGQVRNVRPREQLLTLLDIATGKPTFTAKIDAYYIQAVACAPDGKSCAALFAAPKPQILVFEVGKDKPVQIIDLSAKPEQTLMFTPDGKRIACGMHDSSVLVFDLQPSKSE